MPNKGKLREHFGSEDGNVDVLDMITNEEFSLAAMKIMSNGVVTRKAGKKDLNKI